MNITRRNYLKTMAFAGAGLAVGGRAMAAPVDCDRFGGWTGKRFEATGFFRTEQAAKHCGDRKLRRSMLSFSATNSTP